jgi:membrane protease YdiL (CAAX protease family)
MQTYLKTKPAWQQLVLFIGIAIGIAFIASFISQAILSGITGLDLQKMVNVKHWDMSNPQTMVYIRGMLLTQFLGLFVIPSLLFGYFSDPQPLPYLGIKPPSKAIYWVLGIAALLVSIPFIEYIGLLNQKLRFGNALQQQLKGMEEELFFRGVLQRILIRLFKSPWAGIIFTAILFSGIHLQFFGFFPRLLLGMLLGAVYWYSGSLWPAIIAHFFYDGLIIVLFYLKPEMAKDPDATLFQPAKLLLLAVISAAATALIVWYMRRQSTASYASVYGQDVQPEVPSF